jgi:hypothetical protein
MADISSMLLCVYAEARDGVLFVGSGGVTRVVPPTLPAPLGLTLALVVELGHDEIDSAHELLVTVKDAATADQLMRATFEVPVGYADLEPGESLYVPLTVQLCDAVLASYGAHDVHAGVDGGAGRQLTFYTKQQLPTMAAWG